MRALVTGASSGIGREFALTLGQRGYDLVVVARDAARLQELAAELSAAHHVDVEVLAADLADGAALARVEDRLRDDGATVDLLVNNAGFGLHQRFSTGDVDGEQRLLDVLVTATMRLAHAAVPGMVRRRRGRIVVVSSVAGWITGGTYSAAKAWQTVFSESLHRELVGTGVTVTALAPGYVHTEFHQRGGMDMTTVPEWLWLDARSVVDRALRDVAAGRAVSVPGAQYRLIAGGLQYLPRPLVRRITGGPGRNGLRRKG